MTTLSGKGMDDEDDDNNNNQPMFDCIRMMELLIEHVLGWILWVQKGGGGGDDDIVRQGQG